MARLGRSQPFKPLAQPFRTVSIVTSLIKTINGLARASIKTLNGLALASVKKRNGLDNV